MKFAIADGIFDLLDFKIIAFITIFNVVKHIMGSQ